MKIWVKNCRYNCLYISILSAIALSSVFAEEYYDDAIFYEDVHSEMVIYDPFEEWNRSIFGLNDSLYEHVIGPTNYLYSRITTKRMREWLRNFVHNLRFPVRFLSNVAQLKHREAFYEAMKFGLNSTVGILGLQKPSDRFAHLKSLEAVDFGHVLAKWGVPEGPYLVIPILGPSTLRDFPTKIVEPIINPFGDSRNIFYSASKEWKISFYMAEFFVLSSETLPQYDLIKSASLDPYVSIRTAYYQLR
tara:strand:+ start:176 stop:916 length:741 start_codon:yes stop_codon:yes gene_type:complete